MARRRNNATLTPDQKKQARKIKRELRKANAAEGGLVRARPSDVPERTPHEDRQFWLGTTARMKANTILNSAHVRPYWLSIPETAGGAGGPISPYYPCTQFTRFGRRYYGFSFREHREKCWSIWSVHRARKELTGIGQTPLF